MVPQIDEKQPAMVAGAMNPARKAHARANVGATELAAFMGAVGVHRRVLYRAGVCGK